MVIQFNIYTKMKYLRKFNESTLDRDEIMRLLRTVAPPGRPRVPGYTDNDGLEERVTINPDGTIDVDGDICIDTDLKRLPIQFGIVTGFFWICGASLLTTLEGCPRECENFSAEDTLIKSLVGGPEVVYDRYDISGCKRIKNLEGAPRRVGVAFWVNLTPLTSLMGVPDGIEYLYCRGTNITDLKGAPNNLKDLDLGRCEKLTSLEGIPQVVEDITLYSDCPLLIWDPTPLKDCQFVNIDFSLNGGGGRLLNLIDAFNPSWHTRSCRLIALLDLPWSQKRSVFQNFKDSLDYNYIRWGSESGGRFTAGPALNLFRFKEALSEFDITRLRGNKVEGYVFVNDEGKRVNFDGELI